MSHDAQHRAQPQLSRYLTDLIRARLEGIGYTPAPDFYVIRCPHCHTEHSIRLQHELINGEYQLYCTRCHHRTERTYFDPITAVIAWNHAAPNHIERPFTNDLPEIHA